jgi:2-dehydro-3-deoxyphosphooctonate aldolase (KDO 8-P synthase)
MTNIKYQEQKMQTVKIGDIKVGNNNPLVLIGGPCVIESEDLVLSTAEKIKKIADKLGFPFIFKSSYLKDNRSSANSYQGPGLENGLKILQKVKEKVGIPVLSDIHDLHDADTCAEVLDVIQIPAYLSMQTGLALAVARTGVAVNIKKGQFLHPADMQNVIKKITGEGNQNILLTDRGTFFGYHNLVLDMRNLKVMRDLGYPVVLDPTHAIRKYGVSSSDKRGGAKEYIFSLSRAGTAAGIDSIFIETHPDCDNALCDAASMLPLQRLEDLLKQVKAIDEIVKPVLADDEVGL